MSPLIALALTAHIAVFPQKDTPGTPSLPTSDLIDVAKASAAVWEGGSNVGSQESYYDVVDPTLDKLPGFRTVLYYIRDRPILAISINLYTGQVIDRNRCIYFLSEKLTDFGIQIRRVTKQNIVPLPKLAESVGCDKLVSARQETRTRR